MTYNVTASDSGPDTATNVTITDTIPSGLTNPQVTVTGGSYTITNGVITWTLNLNSGSNATLTLTGSAASQSTIINIANKTSQSEYDPTTPDTATASVYVPLVDIFIYNNPWGYDTLNQKYIDSYSYGNVPVYMLTVYNSAVYDEATGVVVQLHYSEWFPIHHL